MRILGVDPGSETTGWGVIDVVGRRAALVAYGTVRAAVRERFSLRLLTISNGIEEVIKKYEPQACSIEEGFYAVNVKTAIKLGQARGVILVAAERAGLEIAEYAPRLVKQTVVGYGAAEKHQVAEMVRLLLNLQTVPQPHDASDALALALCHLQHYQTAARILSTRTNRATVSPADLLAPRQQQQQQRRRAVR